jgi:hypothetical protein
MHNLQTYHIIYTRKLYDSLLEALRQGRTVHSGKDAETESKPPPPPSMQRGDFPGVRYWYQEEYTRERDRRRTSPDYQEGPRGRGRARDGENVSMWFIEDHSGNPVDGNMASRIRDHTRLLWRMMYEEYNRDPGSTWKRVDPKAQNHYYQEMESKFPVLRLCEGNWKSRMICTLTYTQWYKRHLKNNPIKYEEGTLPENEAARTQKRPADASPTLEASKKSKGK